MKKSKYLTKKARVSLLFQSDQPNPEMGELTAVSILKALKPEFFDREICTRFILQALHEQSAECPHCMTPISPDKSKKFWSNRQVYCTECRKKFHATTKSPLSGTTLCATQIVCMAVLLLIGFSDGQVAGIIDSNHHTVAKYRHLLSVEK